MKKFYTVNEVALEIGVNPMTILRMIKRGDLLGKKLDESRKNSKIIIPAPAAEALFARFGVAQASTEVDQDAKPGVGVADDVRTGADCCAGDVAGGGEHGLLPAGAVTPLLEE